MSLTSEFVPLELSELRREAAVMKADGWRFIQTHAVYTDEGIDLYYSFMKNGHIKNYRIAGVTKETPVPSITDLFLAAFVFENEARELFGVDMRDIVLDFQGGLYAPAISEPMTIITPEQKAAREKAKKAAAAKAAKEEAASTSKEGGADVPQAAAGKRVFVMTPELQARLDAKYPTLSDEKKAKVDAALAARKAEAESAASAPAPQAGQAKEEAPARESKSAPAAADAPQAKKVEAKKVDTVLESKIAALDPAKAAIVRAALGGADAAADAPAQSPATEAPSASSDAQLEHLIGLMDDAKAATVRAAIASKGGE